MTNALQPGDSELVWGDADKRLREKLTDWLKEYTGPEEVLATLEPWVSVWISLIGLALEGPYRTFSRSQRVLRLSEQQVIFEAALRNPAADLAASEAKLRTNLLEWIEQLGSVEDEDGNAYLAQSSWSGLLLQARSLQAADSIGRRIDGRVQDAIQSVMTVKASLENDLQRLSETITSAEEAALRAEHAEAEARKAAGEKGLDEFGKQFGKYAGDQLDTARTYRGWTIAVLIVALSVASLFVLEETFNWGGVDSTADDWHSVAYRLAIVAGLSGLSAYLGRQSSQHRRLGDWARALEVQSRSFGAFVEPIADPGVKNSIYSAMSARLLAPPPEKQSAEQAVPTGAVDRIVDAIIRRGA